MVSQDDNSLNLAYDFVRDSYDWMLRRMDAMERRIDSILLFISTLTFAVPTATVAISGIREPQNGLDITAWHNIFAVAALACFLIATVAGLIFRGMGELKLTVLSKLLDYQEGKTKEEFQRDMISFAGKQFEKNLEFIAGKARKADILSGILVVEILLWIPWIYHTL